MDSWLKKSFDNVNKGTGDDVELAVNTNANRMFAYALGTNALILFFFRMITTNTQLAVFIILIVKGRGNF